MLRALPRLLRLAKGRGALQRLEGQGEVGVAAGAGGEEDAEAGGFELVAVLRSPGTQRRSAGR